MFYLLLPNSLRHVLFYNTIDPLLAVLTLLFIQ